MAQVAQWYLTLTLTKFTYGQSATGSFGQSPLLWGQGKLLCSRKPIVFRRPMETANLQILCILQICKIKAEDNKM